MPNPLYSPDLVPRDCWLNDYSTRNFIDEANEKASARVVSKVPKNIPEEEYKRSF